MPLILAQKVKEMTYNDVIGELYHYPKNYWKDVNTGEIFVYYHPQEKDDKKQYYFGIGKIGSVYPDPNDKDSRFAEILDYSAFKHEVYFKDENGLYLERRESRGEQFFRSVRLIDQDIFDRIVSRTQLTSPISLNVYHKSIDIDALLKEFNQEYQNLTPKKYARMVSIIDRPTSVSDALKKRANYTCQICGERYVEAHHVIELNEMVEGSLTTDNILIVCPTCHRKLHYANVTYGIKNNDTLLVNINGKKYSVKRNLI